MTAPAARIAEIVAEGRRLEESAAFVGRESVPWEEFMDACARVEAFYAENGPALLAVAEAAERFRVSGERWLEMPEGKPETEKEWESMNDAREELFALLTGNAARVEEKTS